MRPIYKNMSMAMAGIALGVMPAAVAAENTQLPWEFGNSDYQGFYLYGQFGHASADLSRGEADYGLKQIDSSINAVSLEESGEAWSLGAGYFFNDWLSAELGWIDLGKRSLQLNQGASFPGSGYQYYPQSGEGLSLAALVHIPLGADFYLAPKLGLFAWQDASEVRSDRNGNDIWYGAEVNYRLDDKISIFAGWQQFDLPRQKVDFLSMGLRYTFGAQAAAAPAKPVKLKSTPARELDTDGDGVADNSDTCPNTPVEFKVDAKGCTVYKDERREHRLVINFDHDSSKIDSKYDQQLQQFFDFMDEHNIEHVQIEGHTSAPGSEKYNQRLSQQRAESVVDALSEKFGIDKSRFTAIGKGESQLLDTSNTEQANATNRRIEVVVEKEVRTEVRR